MTNQHQQGSKKIKNDPESNRESADAPEPTSFRIESGELLLWKQPQHGDHNISVVCLGAFRDGTPAINFRKHDQIKPGVLRGSRDGVAVSIAEFEFIAARILRIVAATTTPYMEPGARSDAA